MRTEVGAIVRSCYRSSATHLQSISVRAFGALKTDKLAMRTQRVHDNGCQNDSALNGSFPIDACTHEGKRRSNGAQQPDTENRSNDSSCSPCNCRATNNDRSNDFHFQPQSGVARNLVKADRVENCSKTCEDAGQNEYRKCE